MHNKNKTTSIFTVFIILLIIFSLIGSCKTTKRGEEIQTISVQPTDQPPASLSPEEVPQFVVLGFDDNGYSGFEGSESKGGMRFVLDLYNGRKNPAGNGNKATFDGADCHTSFYMAAAYMSEMDFRADNTTYVKKAWREAFDNGHEIGNHTFSHWHGYDLSTQDWIEDIMLCDEYLGKPFDPEESIEEPSDENGIGIESNNIIGFRTPFLEYNSNTFVALSKLGFRYDCSITEGKEDTYDGTNYVWPYTLDRGSNSDNRFSEDYDFKPVGSHKGLWEIPVYYLIVPPDDLCEEYGVPSGLRAKLAEKRDYFNAENGKVIGFDWNIFFQYNMTKEEALATLKYSLDLRLQGNRAPFTFGTHSDVYADQYHKSKTTTYTERQEVLTEFLDYALSKDVVRVVSTQELVSYLTNPVSL